MIFQKKEIFDGYSFGFVDVELDPDFKKDRQKYEGGVDALPFLRENAPWLPIIGYSKHYALVDSTKPEELNYLISAFAGMFSFDIRIPRLVLGSTKNNSSDVLTLLNAAQTNRFISCMGEFPHFEYKPEIKIPERLKTELNNNYEEFESLIEKLFWFSKKVVIENFVQGHSGSFVLKAYTDLGENHLGEESIWVIKVNKSPSKLHKELKSHQLMCRKGIPHAMMVPLLWPNVISDGNCAIIGYQFAKDFSPLSAKLSSKIEIISALDKISNDFNSFYNNSVADRFIIRDILKTHIGLIELDIVNVVKKLDPILKKLLKNYINNDEDSILDKSFNLENCIVHGDLHCDNIMINISNDGKENNVLFIDFAHSKKGPVVNDISKLFVDIIVRLSETEDEEFKGFDEGHVIKGISDSIKKIFDINNLFNNESDLFVLNLFIIFQVFKYLDYYKHDAKKVKWLKHYLEYNAKIDGILS